MWVYYIYYIEEESDARTKGDDREEVYIVFKCVYVIIIYGLHIYVCVCTYICIYIYIHT